MADDWESGEFETVVNKKAINREVRRQRKEAEAAAAAAAIGEEPEEFDPEAFRRAATASFYGAPKQKAKKAGKKTARGPDGDFEYEIESGTGLGGQPNEKRKKSKKPSAPKPPSYDTADELAEALLDILTHQPPTAGRSSSLTVASLGDKLQTLTKAAWNKKYKASFGSLKTFLERRPEFSVQGEEVFPSGKASGAAGKSPAKPKKSPAKPKSPLAGGDEDDDEDDDEEDEDDDAADGAERPASPRKTRTKQASSGGSSVTTVLAVLVLIAATVGAYIYLPHLRK